MADEEHRKRSLRLIALVALFTLALALRCSYLSFGLPRWPTSLEASLLSGYSALSEPAEADLDGGTASSDSEISESASFCLRISPTPVRLLSVLLSAASVVLLWLFVKTLWTERAAYVAAVLLAVHPGAVFWARFAHKEALAGVLWLVGVLLLVKPSKVRPHTGFFLAGLLLVLGSGAAAGAAVVWAGVMFAADFWPFDMRRMSLFALLLGLLLFFCDVSMLVPISICIISISGLILGSIGGKARATADALSTNALWGLGGAVVGTVVTAIVRRGPSLEPVGFDALYTFISPKPLGLSVMPILLAASLGLGFAVVNARKRDLPWLSYIVLAIILSILAKDHSLAPGVASAPLVCAFAAVGIVGFVDLARVVFKRLVRFRHAFLLLVVCALILPFVESSRLVAQLSKTPTLEAAADWIEAQLPADATIVIERGVLELPSGELEVLYVDSVGAELPDAFVKQGVACVVLSEPKLGWTSEGGLNPEARAANYARLLSMAKSVSGFSTNERLVGPKILVIQL